MYRSKNYISIVSDEENYKYDNRHTDKNAIPIYKTYDKNVIFKIEMSKWLL